MSRQRIYIAGKVTGEDVKEVTAKFGAAQQELEALGYEVVNPLAVTAAACRPGEQWLHMDWTSAMKLTVAAMLGCDCVYFLNDWRYSAGATIEHDLCMKLRIPVRYQAGD